MHLKLDVSCVNRTSLPLQDRPPPLKSLAGLVFAMLSRQLEMGRGFNIYVKITGQQYVYLYGYGYLGVFWTPWFMKIPDFR